jgi:hypothetical protein
VKSFNADWKKAIDQMSQELMMSFVNFKNGQQILQVGLLTCCLQLVQPCEIAQYCELRTLLCVYKL